MSQVGIRCPHFPWEWNKDRGGGFPRPLAGRLPCSPLRGGGVGQLMEESRPNFKSNIQHQCSYSIYFWNPSLLQLLSYTVHHSNIFYLYATCVASRVYIYITEGKSYIKDFYVHKYYTILCLSIIHFEKLQKSCVGTIICKPYYCSFGESLGVSKKLC